MLLNRCHWANCLTVLASEHLQTTTEFCLKDPRKRLLTRKIYKHRNVSNSNEKSELIKIELTKLQIVLWDYKRLLQASATLLGSQALTVMKSH